MGQTDKLQEKLIDYVQDAHAMEINVQAMLNSMIVATSDPDTRARLEQHLEETRRHADRLGERLEALDAGGSIRKQLGALVGAFPKGLLDQVRTDKPGKNARDGFVTENLEIAAYQLLERLAKRAGDTATATVAAENRADEERMRDYFDGSWDRVIELTLADAGVAV